jgi:ribosomal protein L11 methylase PrmA
MGMTAMPTDLERSTTVARLVADEATAHRIIDLVAESYDPLAAVAGVSEDGPGRWAVAIHFRDPPNEPAVRALVASSAGPDAANTLWFETTIPNDWVKASHEGLKPVEAGRFVVHTPHYRGHAPPNRIAIEIEASLAFGTGHHGTTRGCLLALDRFVKRAKKRQRLPVKTPQNRHATASRGMRRATPHRSLPPCGGGTGRGVRQILSPEPPPSPPLPSKGGGSRPSSPRPQCPFTFATGIRARTVLDIGTGTGVLAIAAARALRCRVMASDIDPVAVRVARANVRLNRAAGLVEVMRANGLGVRRLAGRYELVLANILLEPLQRLATPIARNLAPGGQVVLSGLLRGQAGAALAPYIARGLMLRQRIPLEGWMTLVLERKARPHKALRHKVHRGVAVRRSAQ